MSVQQCIRWQIANASHHDFQYMHHSYSVASWIINIYATSVILKVLDKQLQIFKAFLQQMMSIYAGVQIPSSIFWIQWFGPTSKVHSTYSAKEMRPSLFVSNSIKNSDGAQCNSPGLRSPLNLPSRTMVDSDGGKTGTTALIKSAGNM
jgi:hypothetical protein